jgi:hypothetical protein
MRKNAAKVLNIKNWQTAARQTKEAKASKRAEGQ